MKLKILSVFVALACTACSDEGIQLDLEKAKPNVTESAQEPSDSSTDGQAKQDAETNSVSSSLALVKNNSTLTQKVNPTQGDTSRPEPRTDANIGLVKAAPIDPEVMREHEASLAQVNDAELMALYGAEGSAIDLQLGGTDLVYGSIALNVSKQTLVSNVTSVSGATSITGDPTGFGFTIGLSGDYLFEFDKDTLTPKAQAALESVLALYKDYQGTSIEVAGHTDSKGTNDYNLDLSKRRASSVERWFEATGIDSALITTNGYGETKPVAKNMKNGQDFPEGRALNRRVDIKVKTEKKVNHLPTVSKPTAF